MTIPGSRYGLAIPAGQRSLMLYVVIEVEIPTVVPFVSMNTGLRNTTLAMFARKREVAHIVSTGNGSFLASEVELAVHHLES